MKPILIPPLSDEQRAELDTLYRTTRTPRLRTRAQVVLLAADRQLHADQLAALVPESRHTVRRWLKRYLAHGVAGLAFAPIPGRPPRVTAAYRARLRSIVRQRPRSLDLPFSLWTAQRLADVLADHTGIRVSDETIRRELARADIVLSRPQHTISSPDPEYAVKKKRSRPRAIP